MSCDYLPRISGNEDLRETDNVGALAGGLLNKSDGLVDTALEVLPGRLGLDSSDLELGGHLGL